VFVAASKIIWVAIGPALIIIIIIIIIVVVVIIIIGL